MVLDLSSGQKGSDGHSHTFTMYAAHLAVNLKSYKHVQCSACKVLAKATEGQEQSFLRPKVRYLLLPR
jgi:hypothetical protein